ncbi:MAG: tetratricopeptide repeat protein [Rhizobiaceae bacterium]
MARTLRQGLAGFEMVNLVLGGEPTTPLDFSFAVNSGGDIPGVSVVLSDGSGKVLDLRAISVGGDVPVDDQVAALLSSTVTAAGAVFASIGRSGSASGLVHCLLVNDEYYLDQSEDRHRDAYTCMEGLVEQGVRSPLVFSELASLELKAVTEGYAYPPGASQDRAFVLARRAVKVGMNSPYAHRALGFLFGRTGNEAESVRWMRKAYELNTYDMSMAAAYGYSLVFAGDYRVGEPIMSRAVEAASAHPSWWDFGLFIARFMLDDTAGATRATEPLIGGKRQHYVAALAVMAQANGDRPRAATLLSDLAQTYPDFAAYPARTLTLAHYPADFVARFTAALRAAGLGSSG